MWPAAGGRAHDGRASRPAVVGWRPLRAGRRRGWPDAGLVAGGNIRSLLVTDALSDCAGS